MPSRAALMRSVCLAFGGWIGMSATFFLTYSDTFPSVTASAAASVGLGVMENGAVNPISLT